MNLLPRFQNAASDPANSCDVGVEPQPLLSVVLPCYNEAACISQILSRFAEVGRDVNFELILVNNGSRDNTAQVMAELVPAYPFARSVEVLQNQGYGHGILAGLRNARGELLAWSHADLQTDPADVFRALSVYQESSDPTVLVKGVRHGRRFIESCISLGMQMVALVLLRRWFREINAQPKLFHRSLLDRMEHAPADYNFDTYFLYQARRSGWRFRSIDVVFPPRRYGKSNWAATWRSKIRTIQGYVRFMFRLGTGSWR